MDLKPSHALASPITDVALLHKIEHADGWAYAVVWRFATRPAGASAGVAFEPLGPPDDLGKLRWELNTDRAPDRGREVSTPAWSDGTRYLQATYWRARLPRRFAAWDELRRTRHVQLADT